MDLRSMLSRGVSTSSLEICRTYKGPDVLHGSATALNLAACLQELHFSLLLELFLEPQEGLEVVGCLVRCAATAALHHTGLDLRYLPTLVRVPFCK